MKTAMARIAKTRGLAGIAILATAVGCATPGRPYPAKTLGQAERRAVGVSTTSTVPSLVVPVSHDAAAELPPAPVPKGDLQQLALAAPAAPAAPEPLAADRDTSADRAGSPIDDPSDPFYGQSGLSLAQLVGEVEARNPSLQAASEAWRAAAERYPQVVSLDDPMFSTMISPTGVGKDNGGGWMTQVSQKVPWCGKRGLRGSAAAAEADAMLGEIGDTRLRLAEATRTAFFSYYLASRQTEVNHSTQQLVTQLREIAVNKYQVGQVSQQDVLQADVELADLQTRLADLSRDRQVAIARINTLLHRWADCPLPAPPKEIALPEELPAVDVLQAAAAGSRPDLYSQYARIRTEEANLALACKEYYPDFNLAARYDGFMPEDMRTQLGFDVNVPLWRAKRDAAVREASNRVAQRRAEYQDRLDQVRYEVQSAYARAAQAGQVVRLYRDKTLPAVQRSLESARSNYTTGNLDFLRLLDAERQLFNQRDRYYMALAEYHQRLAELERAVGEALFPLEPVRGESSR